MEADTTHPASPPDPPQDQPGNPMPEYIAVFLHAVSILLGYGRHLLATVHHRAAAPTFPTIAAGFGTANLSTILRPPQSRPPACRRAGALPARPRRNRPRHQPPNPPHSH